MITYNLAKQLKEAGYPQRKEWESGYFFCEDCKEIQLFKNDPDEGNFVGEDYEHRWRDFLPENWITVPTLSELVEACGDGLKFIRIMRKRKIYESGGRGIYSHGSTPEEAVAKLWLELIYRGYKMSQPKHHLKVTKNKA